MKRIFKYPIYILIGTFTLTRCVSLDEDPKSFVTVEQFYQNEDEADAAIVAGYRKLYESGQSLYNSLFQIGVEMAADDYAAGPRARNAHVRAISGLTHDAMNDRMEQLWKQSYSAISASNIVIDRVPKIDGSKISEAARERIIAEAKFLRALHYFNLVRWFGGVPLVLSETTSLTNEALHIPKSTVEEVYAQIERDLLDAEVLPAIVDAKNIGRATRGAAKSLLAKVYLTEKKWELAAEKSKEVIDAGTYALFEDFADVFNVATKNGKEHIFSAQFKGFFNYQGNTLGSRAAPLGIPGINGDQSDMPNKASGLYESYDANDKRRDVTFITSIVSPTNGQTYTFDPHFHKYFDETVMESPGNSSKNLPIIRYADVLLIFAEALNELNQGPTTEAYWAIDEVRERAGIDKLIDVNASLSVDEFREYVFEERRKEFVYEYQRWFDLSRRGADYYVEKLKAAGKTNAAPKHIVFPTPQRELNLNPQLKQHPSWKVEK
jgi:hypothetical protein